MPDEGLSTEGKIEIEVVLKNYQQASRDLNALNESLGGNSKEVQRLTDLLRPADDAAARFGKSLQNEGAAVRSQVADFDALTKQLRQFVQAHRDAAQLGVVGGSLDGTATARLEAMSTAELKQYIAIDDARGVNAVSVARKIVAARESEIEAQRRATAALSDFKSKTIAGNVANDQNNTYNDYLVSQREGVAAARERESLEATQAAETTAMWDAVRKRRIDNELAVTAETARQSQIQGDARRAATAEAIAAIEKERQAFTAAYAAELNAALRVDEEIATSQQARRFAPGGLNTASRNTANPTAMMAAQQEYAAQETKQLSAALREQEGATRASGQGMTSLAYSLFNLSFMAGTASAGLIAMDVATIKTAADYQRGFADVARTSGVAGAAADMLKQSLIELTTAIPVTFDDIAKIGTLAGQLDISAANIENFSKATAMFSATSNVGVDDAATALGRLGQLLPDVQGDYERLASTILKVGVSSVATESQIIAISTQVAGLAVGARLTTPDVIALSAALASVGVQPERSRGLVTRLFTNIEVAVASGGKRLQDFGAISGQTASEFAAAWKSAPMSAIAELLDGIKAQGDGAISTMKALGIASARDIPSIQNLIAQPGLLRKEMKDSSGEWVQQTELTKQFGVIADTVSSRLVVLQNNFKAMLDAAGSSANGPFIGLINGLDDFLKLATKIISSPVGQWFTVAGIGAVALTGALLAAAAAAAITAAGFLLVKSALDKEAISATAAAVATNVFKGALVTTGIGAVVVLLGTLAGVIMAVNGAFDSAKSSAEGYFGSIDGLVKGMQADQAVYEATGKSIQQIGTEQGTATVHADSWVGAMSSAVGAQIDLNDKTSHTTEAIKRQTTAYGENAQAALRASIANSSQAQDLFNNKGAESAIKMAGGSFKGLADAIGLNPVEGGKEYVKKLYASIRKQMDALPTFDLRRRDLIQASKDLGSFRTFAEKAADLATASANKIAFLGATEDGAAKSTGGWSDQVTNAAGGLVTLSDQVNDNVKAMYESVNAGLTLQSSTEALGEAFYNNGAAAASQGAELQAVVNDIIASSAGPQDAANMLQGFYDALIKGAGASTDSLQILAQVIASLGGATSSTAFSMAPFIQGQTKARAAAEKTAASVHKAAKEVRTYVDYANDLKGVFDRTFDIQFGPEAARDAVTSAEHDIQKGFEDADQKVADLRKQLSGLQGDLKNSYAKTYAEQFSTLLGDGITTALQNGFGKQTALDDITTAVRALGSALDDSRQRLDELHSDMASLTADRGVKEYWLKVAENYGDSLRATELQADIKKIDADQAATSKSIQQEQANTSRSLNDGSDASIKNRKDLLGLVDQYVAYIKTLSDAGTSSKVLTAEIQKSRDDFMGQAESLGFAQDQLKGFGDLFDSFKTTNSQAALESNRLALVAQQEAQAAVEQTAKDLKQAEDDASRSLDGDSAAAIKNRAAVRDLVQKNQEYLVALANSGVGQDGLKRKSADLRGEFIRQLTQVGLSKGGIDRYKGAFDQLTIAIGGVPQNVTTIMHAGTGAASQALDEYRAKLDAISNGQWGGGNIAAPNVGNAADIREAMGKIDYYAGVVHELSLRRPLPWGAVESANSSLTGWTAQLHALRGYFDGGFVGDGGKYQPMGVVHGGEFVFTKEETAAIGPQNLATIASMAFSHNMSKGSSAPATSAGSLFGNGVVQLSPFDRQLLIDIRDRQGITLSGNAMQRFAGAGNINSSNRGAA